MYQSVSRVQPHKQSAGLQEPVLTFSDIYNTIRPLGAARSPNNMQAS